MTKVNLFVKVSAVTALAAMIALASAVGNGGYNASAATDVPTKAATAAATKKADELKIDTVCKPPPTATPVPATKVATVAATKVATKAATMAATMAATKVATVAATKAAVVPATKAPTATKPPTAVPTLKPTEIVKGKEPAWAGFTLSLDKGNLRGGKPCIKVAALTAKGPAAVAGLVANDLVLGVEKIAVVELFDVFDVITGKKSGDTIEITYQRDGKVSKAKIILGQNPNSLPTATPAK